LIAHEYGHHISAFRPGGAYGTPRWDIAEHVCELVEAGVLAPGNEGRRYWENPEEAFAESYAALTFPETIIPTWQFSAALRPTMASAAAIRGDVSSPWPNQYARSRLAASCP
jgi:hypothetical protein